MKKKQVRPQKIKVKDIFQTYTYTLTEPEGKNFHPEFKPDFTPKEMLELGIFGGMYFHGGGEKEFPRDWFAFKKDKNGKIIGAKISPDGTYKKELNYFKVKASQSLTEWRKKGWIHKDDPRGWIEWYFRYYYGRRLSGKIIKTKSGKEKYLPGEDDRQITRWKAIRRHIAQVQKNCRKGDLNCRSRQRQAILHWAYDSRKI